jgi:hypothetical protein
LAIVNEEINILGGRRFGSGCNLVEQEKEPAAKEGSKKQEKEEAAEQTTTATATSFLTAGPKSGNLV